MEHQRTVKDDNMMPEGLMQHRDERRGRSQPRQPVILDWAVREPRRSRRTRRELNYPVFSSRGSKIGSLASTSNQSLSRSKNLGKSKVQEKEVLKAVKSRKEVLEHQITKSPSKTRKEEGENINTHVQRVTIKSLHNQELQNLGKSKVQEKEVTKALKHRKREHQVTKGPSKGTKEQGENINTHVQRVTIKSLNNQELQKHQVTKGPSKRTKEPADNINTRVQPVILESFHNRELQNLGKSKVQEEKEVTKAVKHRKRVLEHHVTKGPSKRTKEQGENINTHVQRVTIKFLHNQELQKHKVIKGPSKRTKEPTDNINTHVQPVILESFHNQELQNVGKSKLQEKEVLKAVMHRKRVPEHQITKGPSKRTKEPAENINSHVQGVNIETLHNQELQIPARSEADVKKKKKRMTELAVMKATIEQIKEEQESMNLKISARREEELKEIAKREKELQILKNNINSLRKEHNKLVLMTKAHIQGEGLKHQVVCKSADTEVLEVSSARQEAVTSGETHVQEVSSSEHQVLKEVVSSGVTHVPEVVSTSLPAGLEEDRFVLPDLNAPLL